MRPDAIVVGAGIVGAACARRLAEERLRVLLLDAAFAGAGTTAAGMGHIVVLDDSDAQLAFTTYARGLWDALAAELPADCEVVRAGTLWVAEDDAQLDAARARRARWAAHAVDAELLDARALAGAEPELRPGLAGALHVPGDLVVYPPAVARWLAGRAQLAGAVLREGVRVDAIRPRAVVAAGERIEADVVVNATGVAAPELTEGLPIVPRKGHLVITDRYPGFCRHQLVELDYVRSAHDVAADSVAFNVQPRATGQILVGSSRQLAGRDRSVDGDVLRRMLARAAAFLPRLPALSAIRAWTGLRPATPDGLPLVGRWDAVPGTWIAAGHEGLGITTALATAEILADLLLGRPTAIDAAPLAPSADRLRAAPPPATGVPT